MPGINPGISSWTVQAVFRPLQNWHIAILTSSSPIREYWRVTHRFAHQLDEVYALTLDWTHPFWPLPLMIYAKALFNIYCVPFRSIIMQIHLLLIFISLLFWLNLSQHRDYSLISLFCAVLSIYYVADSTVQVKMILLTQPFTNSSYLHQIWLVQVSLLVEYRYTWFFHQRQIFCIVLIDMILYSFINHLLILSLKCTIVIRMRPHKYTHPLVFKKSTKLIMMIHHSFAWL